MSKCQFFNQKIVKLKYRYIILYIYIFFLFTNWYIKINILTLS